MLRVTAGVLSIVGILVMPLYWFTLGACMAVTGAVLWLVSRALEKRQIAE